MTQRLQHTTPDRQAPRRNPTVITLGRSKRENVLDDLPPGRKGLMLCWCPALRRQALACADLEGMAFV